MNWIARLAQIHGKVGWNTQEDIVRLVEAVVSEERKACISAVMAKIIDSDGTAPVTEAYNAALGDAVAAIQNRTSELTAGAACNGGLWMAAET